MSLYVINRAHKMNETEINSQPSSSKPSSGNATAGTSSFLLNGNPQIAEMVLAPISRANPILNDQKIRKLYLQACAQQWYPLQKINFELPTATDPEHRRALIAINQVFYTLEKMGLNVIANMMAKASRKFKSEEAASYLSVQCHDEARHVFLAEIHLKKLGAPPVYDNRLHILGQVASMGFYRVENWLFSTLFSENFASAYLRRGKTFEGDPFGQEVCRNLVIDEARHLHFLHIVLPDILDRMNVVGRSYVKSAQYFIMKFTEVMSRTMANDAAVIGIDRREMLEEVFENIERSYESMGVSRKFLYFPTIKDTDPKSVAVPASLPDEIVAPTVH